ncbi:hypothetical protein Clacol_008659 [Clathrus columnatus]|uniref:Uncharacterized protein n=1 Tax=Clathrus columnatus TaxID=1419009 RepID=A0AAV5AR91_9AGAM|nr:hypothetical protein Clacol_008659 [Clathrus columnatus]
MPMILSKNVPTFKFVLKDFAGAMGGARELLIVDQITPYACSVPNDEGHNIPGPPPPSVPDVLFPSLGKTNSAIYLGNLQMFTLQYGQKERTIGNHIDVTHADNAGWKIVRLYHPSASILAHKSPEGIKVWNPNGVVLADPLIFIV